MTDSAEGRTGSQGPSHEGALLAWQESLLTLADALGPVSHELHNVFNGIVLQAAIVAREVPDPLRDKMNVFRTLAFRASEILGHLDHYRHAVKVPQQPVNLNEVVKNLVRELREQGVDLEEKTTTIPLVMGNTSDLRRLITLLVTDAWTMATPVTVRTAPAEGKVLLTVEDEGPQVLPEKLDAYFDPVAPPRPRETNLARTACLSIAHRLQATLRAVNRDRVGVAVTVELNSA